MRNRSASIGRAPVTHYALRITRVGLLRYKPRPFKSSPRLLVLAEALPYPPAPVVLRHQERDALVDADDVGGDPAGPRVEGVDEPVALPHLVPVGVADVAEGLEALLWRERQAAGGGAGDDGAVDVVRRR